MVRRYSSAQAILLPGIVLCSLAYSTTVSSQPPNFQGGGPGGEDREVLEQFDTDDNGWLDLEERERARTFLKENQPERRGPGGPGFGGPGFGGPGFGGPGGPRGGGAPDGGRGFGPPPGFGGPDLGGRGFGGPNGPDGPQDGGRRGRGGPPGMGGDRPEASEGQRVEKSSVAPLQNDLYDTTVLRTIFVDFENADWEIELEDFHGTDVDVAATLTVDGKTYPNVGIHFRGASSYGMVPAGYKRSLNVSMDMADDDQRLLGYKTLNLLNGASDNSMMSTVLYSHIARSYMPAPKANFVRVVINGENWGVYTNVQQFNKDFLKENYDSSKGTRWKVSGSPRGGGGLDYRGQDPSAYDHPYEQKSAGKKAKAKLIELCRVLEETPTETLPDALELIVDVDELLWFLALDVSLINSDGYWVRASDYSIFLDKKDQFHFIPHDMNEAFRGAGGGPGGRRGGPGGGFGRPDSEIAERDDRPRTAPLELDPMIAAEDSDKPLRSKVLAVPKYREQYLANVRQIAEESLDWNNIGPFVQTQANLIDDAVKTETRKLGSYESFRSAVSSAVIKKEDETVQPGRGHGSMNLKEFFDGRRAYLLK
ncbi:CotH kinase family protein [Neorhodopirellula pilleata]|uniref:CotH protein n=1 Tax=Neorhodopirellula pilleata TaxID=2714738 RepID=A0A5C6AV02_9BACT|nr:CotH kinase family protein [Neorhodopirellula pilleata]TWU03428.1 CotH protein [Neorhodopirellula pilleata]